MFVAGNKSKKHLWKDIATTRSRHFRYVRKRWNGFAGMTFSLLKNHDDELKIQTASLYGTPFDVSRSHKRRPSRESSAPLYRTKGRTHVNSCCWTVVSSPCRSGSAIRTPIGLLGVICKLGRPHDSRRTGRAPAGGAHVSRGSRKMVPSFRGGSKTGVPSSS